MSEQHVASVYGSPALPSFSQAPAIGTPDPHIAHVHGEVAMVSSVASDLLTQVVSDSLDLLSDPSATPEAKEKARQRVLQAVRVVNEAATASGAFAAAEQAHAGLIGTPAAGWAAQKDGTLRTPADEFAEAAAQHFDRARAKMASAAEGMENDPALPAVLARRNQEGGVSGFFRRVASATVSLAALGQRALALPGLVRQAFANGLDRADLAVQDALDRWHSQVGAKVDSLRQAATEKVQEATDAVKGRARAIENAVEEGVNETIAAAHRGADRVKDAALLTADGLMAFDRVASSRLRSFWNETVVPAFQRFTDDLTGEFHNQRSTRSKVNFEFVTQEKPGGVPSGESLSVPPKLR